MLVSVIHDVEQHSLRPFCLTLFADIVNNEHLHFLDPAEISALTFFVELIFQLVQMIDVSVKQDRNPIVDQSVCDSCCKMCLPDSLPAIDQESLASRS